MSAPGVVHPEHAELIRRAKGRRGRLRQRGSIDRSLARLGPDGVLRGVYHTTGTYRPDLGLDKPPRWECWTLRRRGDLIRSARAMLDPAVEVVKHTETTLVRLQALVNGTTVEEARKALATKRREITLGPKPLATLRAVLDASSSDNGPNPIRP